MDSEVKKYKVNIEASGGAKILNQLFDNGEYQEIDIFSRKSEESPELLCGYGNVNGCNVYAFVQNISSNYAAVGRSQAEKISKIYSFAMKTGNPIIGVYDSDGAYLEEGNQIMKVYSDILCSCNKLSGVVPQISVIVGNCYGINAQIASCADIVIVTKDSHFGLDIGGKSSSSDEALKYGNAHIECGDKKEAINSARELIRRFPQNNLCEVKQLEYNRPKINEDFDITNIEEIIINVVDDGSFIELNKEYGKHFRIGMATIYGISFGLIISDVNNSDIIDEESCDKVCKFIKVCDSYSIPLVTFINASGAEKLKSIKSLFGAYADSTTVKVTIISGKACGIIYTTFCGSASADMVLSWPDAVISPLPPGTAIEVLYHDKLKNDDISNRKSRKELLDEYLLEEASSFNAAKNGIVDDIVLLKETRNKIFTSINMLLSKRENYPNKKHSNI